ncbi:MAG TPA: hypothetical protein VG963_04610, partial [Polyangiaceae bacterium]|nr:hypothetical protein [Polyangiaceae bacterium]
SASSGVARRFASRSVRASGVSARCARARVENVRGGGFVSVGSRALRAMVEERAGARASDVTSARTRASR